MIEELFRSKVADLLHLLQFAQIETPTIVDSRQVKRVIAELKAELADADGMCNLEDPAKRCVCREEFGRRVCTDGDFHPSKLPAAQVQGEREGFEAWQRSGGFKRPDDPGEWEAWQARAALYAPPAMVPQGLQVVARRLEELCEKSLRGKAAAEVREVWREVVSMLPTPPAAVRTQAVVMPERKKHVGESLCSDTFDGWNRCIDEFLRLNPHLQPAAPSQGKPE